MTTPGRHWHRRRPPRLLGLAVVLAAALPVAGALGAGSPGHGASTGHHGAGQRATAVAAINRGVVDITGQLPLQGAEAAGTGMVMSPSGLVLTNDHVIRGTTSIKVTVPGGRRYTARVVGTDARHDVAVLRIQPRSRLATVALGDSSRVAVGTAVKAIGNAGGAGGTPTLATGTVTRLHRSVTVQDGSDGISEHLTGLIETNADLQPGDSGGPLVGARGRVVGMDTARSVDFAGQGASRQAFAIPINRALAIMRQIVAGRASADVHIGDAPFLGVQLSRDSAFASAGPAGGAVVAGVVSGSPAEAAGLSAGDTITSLDDTTVGSTTAFTKLLGQHHPADAVQIGWVDPLGGARVATVQLGTGPPA